MNANFLHMRMCLQTIVFLFLASNVWCQSWSVDPALLTREWKAIWIGPPPAAGESDEGVFHFRRSFDLTLKPSSFVVHVTADNRYRLFVNGKSVGLGPARGDKLHWRYETFDLAPFLKSGKNVIAAQVWNLGSKAPVAQMTIGRTAFLMQGNTEKESVVNTDTENWRVVRNNAFGLIPVTWDIVFGYYAAGSTDRIDAARYPWGWETVDYSDNAWNKPFKIADADPLYYAFEHGEADGGLTPRTIPMMEERFERIPKVVRVEGFKTASKFLTGSDPLEVPPNTKATLLLDQTHLTTAYPEMFVSGGTGSVIEVAYAEALVDENRRKGNRNETRDKKLFGYYDIFIPDGGQRRLFRPLWYRTYRYIELRIQTGAQPLLIDDYYGMFTGYPFEQKASFSSSDPSLKNIWDVGWRTARLCANETYYDCPYYEQLQYVGDTRIQALLSLYVTGDDRLMRNALTLFDQSRLPEGITQSRYPTEIAQMIPPFSLFWVDMVHDFFMFRDDRDFVKGFLPGIQSTLGWYENHLDERNILVEMGWWSFVDWADEFNRGVPSGAEDKAGTSIISLQYVYALDRAAQIFSSYGKEHEASSYRAKADVIRKSVYNHCFDRQKRLFADTPEKKEFSQHANVMAILTDAIPHEQQGDLMKRILADQSLIQCSLYFRFYLMNALKKAGMADDYLKHLDIWKQMLAEGLTTFPEKAVEPRSDCHAWSASPMIEFLATVCGVEPAEAGFSKVLVEPRLGPLGNATGIVPHPSGDIHVKFQRKGGNGISAEITLPEGLIGEFVWNNERVLLKSGRQVITKEPRATLR